MHSFQIKRIFYFDESNNIRKGTIGSVKDNNPDLGNLCFVLGGIAVENKIDFDALLNFVGAKQRPRDAKFKFFSYGESSFDGSIAQPRLRKLFEFLLEKDIYIHFDVLHYMHFALVDILDSLIQEDDAIQRSAFYFYKSLQSDMTEVLYKDYQRLHDILVEFEFPNIPKGCVCQLRIDPPRQLRIDPPTGHFFLSSAALSGKNRTYSIKIPFSSTPAFALTYRSSR